MENKGLIIGPLTVIGFIIVLAFMYQWIGDIPSETLVMHEIPETNLVNAQTQAQAHVVNNPTFPVGIGNQNIQLIHNTQPFSAGIGGQQNNQMRLIHNPTNLPAGIGDAQIKLINQIQGGPYIGLDLREMTAALSAELKVPPKTGLYVRSVLPNSPADKAGLKAGDVVLKCDHKVVNTREQVTRITGVKKVGDVIKIHYIRNKRKKSCHVKLEKAPAGVVQVAAKLLKPPVWMGADIQDIDAIMKTQFKLKDKLGVIVSHVAKNSPAQKSGIRTGDVIRRYDGTRVRDVKQLQSLILKGQPGKQVNLTIERKKDFLTIQLVLGQKSQTTKRIPFIGPADIAIEGTWIGMDVTELGPNDAASFGLPSGSSGVLVNDVESPPALNLGFQTGDLIISINGAKTPDMKSFLSASKHLNSAVVDVIRGDKHLFITVPAPGYTRQGTQLNTGLNNFKKVAMTRPISGRFAILTTNPDLNSSLSGNINSRPYVIIVDPGKNNYTILDQNSVSNLTSLSKQFNIVAIICNNINNNSASNISAMGVIIYSGVVGTASDAIRMYNASQLIAMKR